MADDSSSEDENDKNREKSEAGFDGSHTLASFDGSQTLASTYSRRRRPSEKISFEDAMELAPRLAKMQSPAYSAQISDSGELTLPGSIASDAGSDHCGIGVASEPIQRLMPPPGVRRRPSSASSADDGPPSRESSKQRTRRPSLTSQMADAITSSFAGFGLMGRTSAADTKEHRAWLVQALQKHFLFGVLKEAELQLLGASMTIEEVASKEVVVREGDDADAWYLIRSGRFAVSLQGPKGVVCELEPRQSFGEVALLYETCRTASVTCTSSAGGVLWKMAHEDFKRWNAILKDQNLPRVLAFLRQHADFKGLEVQELHILASQCSVQTFPDGCTLLRGGDVGCWMFIVMSGTVVQADDSAYQRTASKDDLSVRPSLVMADRCERLGSILGAECVIYGKRQRVGARAKGPVTCLAFGKVALERIPKSVKDVLRRCGLAALLLNMPRKNGATALLEPLTDEQRQRVLGRAEDAVFENDEIVIAPYDEPQLLVVTEGELAILNQLDGFEQRGEGVFCKAGAVKKALAEGHVECVLQEGFGHGCTEASEGHPMSHYAVAVGKVHLQRLTFKTVTECLGDPLVEVSRLAKIKRALSDIFLFKYLDEEQLNLLVRNLEFYTFEPDEVIVREGDPARHFFLIMTGEIVILKGDLKLRTLGAWDYFGERGLLLKESRSATCQAVEECECAVLDATIFFQVVGRFKKELERRMYLQDLGITMTDLKCKAIVGRGTFGVVRLVYHKCDERKFYALKGVRKTHVVKGNQEKAIVMERDVNKQCFHPCIMQFIKTFQDANTVYFLTEFLGGGDLFLAMRQIGSLTKLQCQFYAGSIALAIEFLHARGIMYRDLKPENVLLDFNGAAKLVDFGCCKRELRTATLIGTPEYLAPEVIKGFGYDCSVDWWSFGVVVFELVVGPLPFGASSTDQMGLFKAIIEEPLQIPDYVKDEAAQLLLHGLLDRNTDTRLGAPPRNAKEIKVHTYFEGLDWNALAGGFFDPPWAPNQEEIMKSWEPSDGDVSKNVSKGKIKFPKGMEWAKDF
eukprot:TRINITY_DN49423_c0_g1_i1.p1 TRINITY_DN49423_c0_g1~~TRINITY_DN49423_c0_g1_i1.p1  ORF type:complete len:1029 (+),score=279.16 TRINITY_DN49423_c0_g1_i1:145-3231(+)